MEGQPTFFRQNTPFGLLTGCCSILAAAVCLKRSGTLFANPALDRIVTFLFILGIFMQIRRYRQSEELKGYISYGRALLTGIYLSAVAAFLYGIYAFYIYHRHPDLVGNYLTATETLIRQLYPGSAPAGDMMKMLRAFTSPATLGFSEFFSKLLMGSLYSLLIAFILRRRRPQGPYSSAADNL